MLIVELLQGWDVQFYKSLSCVKPHIETANKDFFLFVDTKNESFQIGDEKIFVRQWSIVERFAMTRSTAI
uniref:Uncharacterized protein n=1 Tax=Romanomermis culicivorax TaxID=13658 RepID=A0A915JZJ4_ROMCU